MSSTGALPTGTLVAGRYEILEPLAGEGSGAVYRAADTRLDRAVALRAVPAAEAGGGQQGKAAARLVHPNVARVLDFGTDTALELEFVVADLGTGGSLAALLAQRGVPPLPLAMRMVQEAAAGMAAAHRAGLVHGDLHPGVLWLSRDEGRLRVQVLGLGLNPAGAAPPRATARYAAPERLRRAKELSAAADVFSLGVIAYEVFAGLPAEWNQLLLQMARGQAVVAPSLLETRPDLPAHVAQAVRRALAADPASRWPDGGELAAHLIADLASQPHPAEAPADPPAAAVPAIAEAVAPEPAVEAETVPEQAAAADALPVSSAPFSEPEPAVAPEPVAAEAAPVEMPAGEIADLPFIQPAAEPEPVSVDAITQLVPADTADAADAVAAADAAPAEAPPSRPSRQPLSAGRRGKPIALASTDLADRLYIPPALEKASRREATAEAPAAEPTGKAAPKSAETPIPAAAQAPAAPPAKKIVAPPVAAAPAAPVPTAEAKPEATSEPAPVFVAGPPAPPSPAEPAADETLLAPALAPLAAEPAAVADAPIPLPERRRNRGLQRLGEPAPGNRRALLAAGIVIAVIVTGGVVARTVLAGGGAQPPAAANLASRALASAGGAPVAGQPQQAAPADSAVPGAADSVAPPAAALTPEEQRKADEERKRLEDQRRQQQRQQDSLRQAQQLAAQQAAQPAGVAPQQVALSTPPRPVETQAAPRLDAPAPSAPPTAAPERPRADPNRVYGGDELDTRPSLANGSQFRSAVQRTYPGTLRGSGQWGSAVVSFVVLPDGRVDRSSVQVVEASQPAFRAAASAAIANARFTPARVGGQPVRAQVSMPITWQSDGRDDD
jgi:serine/threonine-protein kinase